MKRTILFIGILLIISAGSASALHENEITFQLLRGRAALSRTAGSNWLELGPEPVVIKPSDMIQTEGESMGDLHFSDGSVFRIKSASKLTLLDGSLILQVGEAWFNLSRQVKAFKVETPTTVCSVLGTTFDVGVDKFGQTRVRVFDGIVSVKARDDQRHRQMVLQAGMMTTVKEKHFTSDQIQKFDPQKYEDQMKAESNRLKVTPIKIGPERPGLPPIRPTLTGELKPVLKEIPKEVQEENESGEESNVRRRMSFFQALEDQRVRERNELFGLKRERPPTAYDGDNLETGNQQATESFPGKTFQQPPGFYLPQQMQREGHGRLFGQSGPGPLGIQDERALRDEILQYQEELFQIQERIVNIKSKLESVVQQISQLSSLRQNDSVSRSDIKRASPPDLPVNGMVSSTDGVDKRNTSGWHAFSGMSQNSMKESAKRREGTISAAVSLQSLQENMLTLKTSLGILQEQQQKLMLRLDDLRNRLR